MAAKIAYSDSHPRMFTWDPASIIKGSDQSIDSVVPLLSKHVHLKEKKKRLGTQRSNCALASVFRKHFGYSTPYPSALSHSQFLPSVWSAISVCCPEHTCCEPDPKCCQMWKKSQPHTRIKDLNFRHDALSTAPDRFKFDRLNINISSTVALPEG